jgi:hypothetical protein
MNDKDASGAAEVLRLTKINTQLCADFNAMNQHGAKQDAELARLTALVADLTAANAALAAENARLGKRVEEAENHILWALPLAKGYAASNRHEINLNIIAGCESFLAGGAA